MTLRSIQSLIILSLLFIACGGDDDGSPMTGGDDGEILVTASYEATLTTSFSEEDFPEDYPNNASFGTIVAIVHAPEVNVFAIGQNASDGFKEYINSNDVDALASFISTALGEENEGLFTIQTEGSIAAEETKSFDLTFTPARTRLTVIANLSPSPDWFIGVSSFDITDGDELIQNENVSLRALDAGVDAGITYDAPEESENNVISVINTPPLSSSGPSLGLGQLQLSRVD